MAWFYRVVLLARNRWFRMGRNARCIAAAQVLAQSPCVRAMLATGRSRCGRARFFECRCPVASWISAISDPELPGTLSMRGKFMLLLGCLSNTSHAEVFRVGSDGACTHTSLPAAIADAEASEDAVSAILLANNGAFTNIHQTFDANKQLILRGGYSNCAASFNPALRVTVSGAGSSGSVLTMALPGTASSANITLDTLVIRDGNDFLGGGINIRGGSVRLINSEVRNNTGSLGAGINVALGSNKGNPGTLHIENSQVVANTGATLGGGIYCDDVEIRIVSAEIIENAATTGGGAYLTNLCSIEMAGAGPLYLRNNDANDEGGGAYLNGGARFLNTQDARIYIDGNTAQFGAALYIDGLGMPVPQQTLVSLQHAWIRNNTATIAGVSIQGNARFELRGGPRFVRCESGDYCTRISNHAGGAINMSGTGASLLLDGVAIQNNTGTVANRGAALAAVGNISNVEIRNSLITGNQGPTLVTLELSSTAPAVQLVSSSLVSNPVTGRVFSKNTGSAFASVNLSHSIVHNSVPVNAAAGSSVTVIPGTCLPLVNENSSIGGNVFGRVQLSSGLDVDFVPFTTGTAVDACPITASPLDINQRSRSVDLPISNLLGPQDQGAIERQSDVIFQDDFE
ncbi:MAG: hypothetical protein JNN30_13210 [Rhodanobacteraceae bacterium]|nr:hypothetical protein [Rhodanobacteraceae bacterium]